MFRGLGGEQRGRCRKTSEASKYLRITESRDGRFSRQTIFNVLLLAKLYASRLHFRDGSGAGREEVDWEFGTVIFIGFSFERLVTRVQGTWPAWLERTMELPLTHAGNGKMSRLRAGPNLMLDPRKVLFNLRTGLYETACYGLRATRIGGASHPGPLHQRRAGVLRDLQQNLFTQCLDSLTRAHSPSEHALVVDIPGEAMDVAKMLASLARRAASHDAAGRDIPQCIQQHRWSDLNCPLTWAAAAGIRITP